MALMLIFFFFGVFIIRYGFLRTMAVFLAFMSIIFVLCSALYIYGSSLPDSQAKRASSASLLSTLPIAHPTGKQPDRD